MRIGEQNEGNADNKGGDARNGMGIRVREISLGLRGIWVKIRKLWGIRVVIQGIQVET